MRKMSLTSFLKIKEVKEKFKETFKKPSMKLVGEILAPPQTTNYSLVGTAFDYLMRFILEYHNPHAIIRPWVAENVPEVIGNFVIIGESPELEQSFQNHKKLAEDIIDYAKKAHKKFLETGEIDGQLLQACIILAQTDVIFRTGRPPNNYGKVEEGDMDDLFELMKEIRIEEFIAKEHMLLNPTFGEASKLVGGADADIIMDGVLIDIKTVKDLTIKREYFDQLIGYYVLTRIGGIDGIKESPEIKELGIYFSRYGKLVKFSVKELIAEQILEDFIDWFKEKAFSISGFKE